MRHPGVSFKKVCITNQFFNNTAMTHAGLNNVELLDQNHLAELLKKFPVTMLNVEKLLFAEWASPDDDTPRLRHMPDEPGVKEPEMFV
jgi:hypothetical protein